MVTLPSHTSHALQPFMCLISNLFKKKSEKVRDAIMFRNNHMEFDKITIAG
jgi:hypothetical protein